MRIGLDAFGDHAEPEVVGEIDRRAHDGCVGVAGRHLGYERAVDLEAGERKLAQVRKRREAHPEVVDREADAERVQASDRFHCSRRIGKHRALGDLKVDALALQAAGFQDAANVAGKASVHQHAGGEVDRDRRRQSRFVPGAPLPDACLEHVQRELPDLVAKLRDRDELLGVDHAVLGMLPACQRNGI